jgi:hypothetical protein
VRIVGPLGAKSLPYIKFPVLDAAESQWGEIALGLERKPLSLPVSDQEDFLLRGVLRGKTEKIILEMVRIVSKKQQ